MSGLVIVFLLINIIAAQDCFNTIPIYSSVLQSGELYVAETSDTSDADVVVSPVTLMELNQDGVPIGDGEGVKHYVNFLYLNFTAQKSKSIVWDGVNAIQQDFLITCVPDPFCATFNLSFVTFTKCGSVTTAPPTTTYYADTSISDPRLGKSPHSPLIIWGCNETNPPPASYECPSSIDMPKGLTMRGAFTQYDDISPPVQDNGHVILFANTVSQLTSDIWYGYKLNVNRGDSVEITTWIRFQEKVPKSGGDAFGLGIRGQKPDDSWLVNTTNPDTWYFIRWRNVVSDTGTIGAGLILDSLSEQSILFYDLKVNIYPNTIVKPVMVGTVKFSAAVSYWQWCNPCYQGSTPEYGHFLDFTFNVRVRNNATVTFTDNNTLAHLGGQYDMILSQYIRENYGPEQPMSAGYPQLVSEGASNLFTIRWERKDGTTTYSYDPIINAMAYPPSPSSDSGPAKSLVIILSVCIPFACIIYFIFFCYWLKNRDKPSKEERQPVHNENKDEKRSDENRGSVNSTSTDAPYQALPN